MNSRYLLFIVFALWGFLSQSQFYLDSNGVTIKCPLANVGDTGVVGSTTYVKVDRTTLVASITASPNPADVATCCTSGIEDFSSLFQARFSFNQDISHWDTASATTMREMFRSATVFNQNISNWDVSNVVNMRQMFREARDFNNPIGNWDVSNVRNMYEMFLQANDFNQNIGTWTTSSVTNIQRMFRRARAFNNGEAPGNSNRPLNWFTGGVNSLEQVFWEADSFNQDIGGWDVTQVTDFTNLFYLAVRFNRPLDTWIINNTPGVNVRMREMFNRASAFNQDISSWDTSRVNNMREMFRLATSFNQDIGDWDTSNVTTMFNMFQSATVFNQDITNFDVANVAYMNGMFQNAVAFNNGEPAGSSGRPLNSWNTSNVREFFGTFDDAGSFNQDIGEWDVTSAVKFQWMFRQNAGAMTFDRDISTWCVEHVTNPSRISAFNNNGSIRAEYLPKWGEPCGARVILTDSDGDNILTDTETAIITATFDRDMNNSPQYALNGGAYTNLSPTGDPKIWTFLLDPTPLAPGQFTFTVTGTCVIGGYIYDPLAGIVDGNETWVDSITFTIEKTPNITI